jgi:hypothetical protein
MPRWIEKSAPWNMPQNQLQEVMTCLVHIESLSLMTRTLLAHALAPLDTNRKINGTPQNAAKMVSGTSMSNYCCESRILQREQRLSRVLSRFKQEASVERPGISTT